MINPKARKKGCIVCCQAKGRIGVMQGEGGYSKSSEVHYTAFNEFFAISVLSVWYLLRASTMS